MDREEMIEKLEAAKAEMAKAMRQAGAHEPDWAPLEMVLPYKHCAGFMFMGYDGDIRCYKHGFTRRPLHVDPQGRTYIYVGREESPSKYVPVPRSVAIEIAFDGLKEMGVKRTTPFDEEARRRRLEALQKAGWTVVTVDGSEEL